MKKMMMALFILGCSSAYANDYLYCSNRELKDIRTAKVLRTFPEDHESAPYVDWSCQRTLELSKNYLYCSNRELKDIRTGEVMRTFPQDHESAPYVDWSCQRTLELSK